MDSPAREGERWQLGHRPALDGARGLAIALVVAGHALPVGRTAANVGVTLFFVLSGFLITSLLWEERDRTGRIDLARFYERRVRRLMPAFVLVWVAVLMSMIAIGELERGAFYGAVAASYAGNWLMASGTWLGPLSHTWSLAIEEQFYLVWPVVLLLAIRYLRGGQLALLLGGLAVAVQAARTWGVVNGVDADRLAFGTDMQADALLLGSAVAIVMHLRPLRLPRATAPIALGGLLVAAFVVPEGLTLGIGSGPVVLLSVLLIASLVSRSGTDPLFDNRGLAYLGLVSYGLYLWHYPILWHLGFAHDQPYPGAGAAVLGVVLSVAAAVGSYALVERRFRRRSERTRTASGGTVLSEGLGRAG